METSWTREERLQKVVPLVFGNSDSKRESRTGPGGGGGGGRKSSRSLKCGEELERENVSDH